MTALSDERIKVVFNRAMRFTGVTSLSSTRDANTVLARQIIVAVLHSHGMSPQQIGDVLYRDRSTIVYHLGQIEQLQREDPVLAETIRSISEDVAGAMITMHNVSQWIDCWPSIRDSLRHNSEVDIDLLSRVNQAVQALNDAMTNQSKETDDGTQNRN